MNDMPTIEEAVATYRFKHVLPDQEIKYKDRVYRVGDKIRVMYLTTAINFTVIGFFWSRRWARRNPCRQGG